MILSYFITSSPLLIFFVAILCPTGMNSVVVTFSSFKNTFGSMSDFAVTTLSLSCSLIAKGFI